MKLETLENEIENIGKGNLGTLGNSIEKWNWEHWKMEVETLEN